jgi:transposase
MRSNGSIGYLDGAMMGAAYSVDLRRKVVQACERSAASQAEVARFFGVSQSFVEKLLRLHRRTGGLEPDRKRAGRPTRIDAATCAQVQRWLQEQNDLTLAELADRLQAQCGLCVSISCVWRLMQRLHMRRKKRLFMPPNATHRMYYWHASTTARNLRRISTDG